MKKTILKVSIATIMAFLPVIGFAPTYAADPFCNKDIGSEAEEILGCDESTDSNAISNSVKSIINNVLGVIGIVAVVTIVLGGITYITSMGDSGKVKKAKDTILYASIGLIVVMLSYAIVNWVISL